MWGWGCSEESRFGPWLSRIFAVGGEADIGCIFPSPGLEGTQVDILSGDLEFPILQLFNKLPNFSSRHFYLKATYIYSSSCSIA